jgi:hypothetical protein
MILSYHFNFKFNFLAAFIPLVVLRQKAVLLPF